MRLVVELVVNERGIALEDLQKAVLSEEIVGLQTHSAWNAAIIKKVEVHSGALSEV